ncbi:DUF4160 domain-containing protein [Nitrosomonas ureae]|uniref:DUF4160 domain-containing protein n=1 Tax=Nitrosomonas ureae TaxID=44577 RepID=UPI000CDEB292
MKAVFYFFNQRKLVHVKKWSRIAKFWLDPVRLQSSGGFSRNEMRCIQGIISEH